MDKNETAVTGSRKAASSDHGCDPIGNGKFRMVPSGDIVGWDERNRRLGVKFPKSKRASGARPENVRPEAFCNALARGAVITLKRADGSVYLTFDASKVPTLGKSNPAWLKHYNRACREGRRLGFRDFDVYATRVANRIAIKNESYVVCRNDVIGPFILQAKGLQ